MTSSRGTQIAFPFLASFAGIGLYAGFRTTTIPERPPLGETFPNIVTCGSYLTGGNIAGAQETATVASCATINALNGLVVWSSLSAFIALTLAALLWIYRRDDGPGDSESTTLPTPCRYYVTDQPRPGEFGWYPRPDQP